jgi:acyl dehydratase
MTPTYPIVLGWDSQSRVLDSSVPADVLWLHGEQSFDHHRPVLPGTRVRDRSRIVAVTPKRTGTSVVVATEIHDADGLCCTQHLTLFVVGYEAEQWGTPPADPAPVSPDADVMGESTELLAVDQADRYAAASGDDYAIHLDDEVARSLGLPGRIVHGMCTLAFAARTVRDLARSAGYPALVSLRARFASPAFPGTRISTVVRGDVSSGRAELSFETTSDGEPLITRGRATALPAWTNLNGKAGA